MPDCGSVCATGFIVVGKAGACDTLKPLTQAERLLGGALCSDLTSLCIRGAAATIHERRLHRCLHLCIQKGCCTIHSTPSLYGEIVCPPGK
jgi:hypothetical protein